MIASPYHSSMQMSGARFIYESESDCRSFIHCGYFFNFLLFFFLKIFIQIIHSGHDVDVDSTFASAFQPTLGQ